MKRLLCALLSIMLILSAFPISARGAELSADQRTELEALLIESVTSGTPVEISQFGITAEELKEIYELLMNSGRFPWNTDTNFEFVMNENGIVTDFRPQLLDQSLFNERMYEEKITELIAETCFEGMEPWQIILSVHEYIVTHCTYDSTGANNSYGCLVDGKTACYGYSRLFLEVMERLDIPCKVVIAEDSGDGVGHAWNVVELDGNWYHIDLTWDDPTGCPTYGFGLHKHFLKSDKQFNTEDNGHNFPWATDVTCDNEKFSTAPLWDDVESPVVFLDAQTMLLRRNTSETLCIYAVDCRTMEETLLYEENLPVVSLSTGSFLCGSYGLSLYEGRIYFTNSKEVLSILPDGTDRQVEYTHDTTLDSYIISCDVQKGTLFYSLADSTGSYTDHETSLSVTPAHVHSYSSRIISPTCMEGGYTQWSCDCGIQYETDRTATTDHILSEEIVNKAGVEFLRRSCQTCDYATEEEYVTVPSESTEETAPIAKDNGSLLNVIGKMGPLKWLVPGLGAFALILIIVVVFRSKRKHT